MATRPLSQKALKRVVFCSYSTRHVKMDSSLRVSLEANLVRNALREAFRVSLWNRVPSTGRAQNVLHENYAKQKCLSRGFLGTYTRDSHFFFQFHVSCIVWYHQLLFQKRYDFWCPSHFGLTK